MTDMVVNVPVLSDAAAQLLVSLAHERALALGIAVNIAVVDATQELCAFLRMQGAENGAAPIAIDKAWTSVGFGGRPTRQLGLFVAGLPEHMRTPLLARPRCTPLPGGMPIRIGGVLVGGIGVSGASPEQDEECATAGFDRISADAIG